MKFGIKLVAIAFATANALAGPINIHFEQDSLNASAVKEIFVTEYQIPEDLIELKPVANCDGLKERGKLDLCLKNNGDLLIVSVDRSFISESLKVFQAP